MLQHDLNEQMCRVGPQSPMGRTMRRYWLPFMLAADLKVGDDPRSVELLGERFIAWRDVSGRAGLFAEGCLHRGVSMQLARAEDTGLRCIYHGWKFAVDGTVLETPNVPDEQFKQRIRGRVYPVTEAGGLLWCYLGPRDRQPVFPRFPWMELPEDQRLITRHVEECNFVQVIEGLVDSSHLGFLHQNGLKQSASTDLGFARNAQSMQRDLVPRLEVKDEPFGFYYAAVRDLSDAQKQAIEARITAFVAPCCVLNANGDIATYVVPLSDNRTGFIHVFWSETEAINREPLRSRQLSFVGLTSDALDHFGLTDETIGRADRPNPSNNFLQDRAAMREGRSWSGLPGLIEEDVAASVSAGPIRSRAEEVLSAADIGVTRLYRVLLACADAVEVDQDPPGIGAGIDWSRVAGRHGLLGDGDWRQLLLR